MTIRLRFSSVDDEPEEMEFKTIEDAITYAKQWFLDGYETNDENREIARKEAEHLASSLEAGAGFHCGMFNETIEFIDAQNTGKR